MAQLTSHPKVSLQIVLTLEEKEAMALYDIAGYGTDAFLRVFYENLGRAYLEKNEEGLRSLFTSVREIMPGYIERITDARKVFERK